MPAGLAVLLGAVWSVAPGARPAVASPVSACSTTSGVIVAVDFSHWGGAVERGCDATLTTGYDALYAAGFTTAGDVHDGPAFICRIDNDPTPSEDACVDTPPANAAWSYWHANVGQNTWSLSELGAMSYHPQPGSVDGWTFGPLTPPSFSPGEVRATNPGAPTTTQPAPTTTTRPATTVPAGPSKVTAPPATVAPSSSAPAATSSPAAGSDNPTSSAAPASHPAAATTTPAAIRPGAPATTVAAGSPGPVGQPGASGTTASSPPGSNRRYSAASEGSSSPTVGTSSSGKATKGAADGHVAPKIVDVSPVAAAVPGAKGSGGSVAPTLIGVSIVVLLVAAGGVTGWRRRQRTG